MPKMTFISGGHSSIEPRQMSLGDDDRAVVVDVGACRSGDEQVAERREEAVAVVLREQCLRVEPLLACPIEAVRSYKGSGVIFGSVDAVGICRHRPDLIQRLQFDREREKELGAAPPTSGFAAQGNGAFAPGDESYWWAERTGVFADFADQS